MLPIKRSLDVYHLCRLLTKKCTKNNYTYEKTHIQINWKTNFNSLYSLNNNLKYCAPFITFIYNNTNIKTN